MEASSYLFGVEIETMLRRVTGGAGCDEGEYRREQCYGAVDRDESHVRVSYVGCWLGKRKGYTIEERGTFGDYCAA